jgi:hypothetical protein
MSGSQRYFNAGVRDGHKGIYNPPHSSWAIDEQEINENRAYDRGYYFGKGQAQADEDYYSPPTYSKNREAYDDGYNYLKTEPRNSYESYSSPAGSANDWTGAGASLAGCLFIVAFFVGFGASAVGDNKGCALAVGIVLLGIALIALGAWLDKWAEKRKVV